MAFGAEPLGTHPAVAEVAHHLSRDDIPSAINVLVRLLAKAANK